ncbi:hypothetical protein JHD48_04315 [Sulfurimonas sp. SAG-AH-194-I05]|nr:hypothetical protein [Sulfurimonas sp. SAG-AH-194-I05]MDF1874953.1 hypothetical protein [Sulfurimonas sp. SAG-AH-194-I05]
MLLVLTLGFIACTGSDKNKILKQELKHAVTLPQKKNEKREAIEIIEVNAENFQIIGNVIPDTEIIKSVKISGAQLNDVISLLSEATDQNIIFQLQSERLSQKYNQNTNGQTGTNIQSSSVGSNTNGMNQQNNDEYQMKNSKVYISSSNISFGRLLQKTVGDKLSLRYEDNTFYLGSMQTVTLKVPSLDGLSEKITEALTSLGAIGVTHDSITSSITFSAREKEYIDVMNYLSVLRNNLYVIEYDIAIYDVELKDNYSLGINWDIIPKVSKELGIVSKTSSSFGSVSATSTTASFGTLLNSTQYTASLLVESLSIFGKVESIQKPKLLGIAGTDVILIDGLSETYIKELKTTSIGNNSVQTSTVSDTVLSGLKVTLNSNIMDTTVITNIELDLNEIVGYSTFTVNGSSYSQPRLRTKKIKNTMRVQPGVPIVISGLFKHKKDKGYKGIPGLDRTAAKLLGGSEYDGNTKTEMVIIVTPRVIKYVIK